MFFKIINKVKSKVKFLRNLENFSLISVFIIICLIDSIFWMDEGFDFVV